MPPKFRDPQSWARYQIGLLLRASGGILTAGAPGRSGTDGLKSADLAASLLATLLMLVALIIGEVMITDLTIVTAYQEFS